MTSTICNALDSYNDAWLGFFTANDTRKIIYDVIFMNLIVYILPMMSQLTCLLFAYMRH